jgi:hypothetical protein
VRGCDRRLIFKSDIDTVGQTEFVAGSRGLRENCERQDRQYAEGNAQLINLR